MEPRLTIITGHYGSGKTEFAVNYAFALARRGIEAMLADLDIVNPYFCSRERKALLEAAGVRMIVSDYASADLPVLSPAVYALFEPDVRGILDVGGDAAGAQVLGRFWQKIESVPHETLCVVNFSRPETDTPEKAARYLRQIEQSARLKIDALVGNTHLIDDTTPETVMRGAVLTQMLSNEIGVPIRYFTVEERLAEQVELPPDKRFALRRYMKKPWEDQNETIKE